MVRSHSTNCLFFLILPLLFLGGVILKHYLHIDFGLLTFVYNWIGTSRSRSARSVSAWELTETYSPAAIDLPPGVWHTLAALSPHAVCYEVKPGPYLPANDKAFAPWAPREGEPGAPAYLASLLEGLAAVPGLRRLRIHSRLPVVLPP